MGFRDISRLRNLFAKDSTGLLNQTQRLILHTIIGYEDDKTGKGCFVGLPRLCEETGLKKRALLQNLHYLGDGRSYKDDSYRPCETCEPESHLNIIRTSHYARKGKQQVYHTDLNALESLLSVRDGAPITPIIEPTSVHLETQSVHPREIQGAPTSQLGSTPVHPYIQEIQDIQDIQAQESYGVRLKSFLDKKLPNEKHFAVTLDLLRMCSELERKGTSFRAIESEITPVGEISIINPKAFVKSRLMNLMEREPDWGANNKPPWCGYCEEISRKNKYLSELPGGNGAMTYSCLNCDPFMVSRRNL